MQLYEIIDQDGIGKVSEKTNISEDILKYLLNEEFENLNRVKSLGFLLILEREYKEIDVAGLRERVKLYFEEHKPDDEKVIVLSKDSVERSEFSFFKWFVILGLLFGGWYMYSQGKLDGLLKNIKEKEDFFDDKKALESNVTAEDAKKVVVENSEVQSVKIDTQEAPKVKQSIALSSEESVVEIPEKVSEVAKIDTPKKTMESVEKAETTVEETAPIEETVEKVVESNLTAEEVVKKVVKEANLTVAVEPDESIKNEIIGDSTTITINPTRGMLWYGFINIDTKVKKEFMKKVSTPFELQSGRWLLVTGHGFVDIVSDYQTVEVGDSQKHYFYIDSTEIRELSKDEFREMNGRRGW